jgi:Fe-Mn family superoxide dismutase
MLSQRIPSALVKQIVSGAVVLGTRAGKIELPALPFPAEGGVGNFIPASSNTISFHYGKHHATYVAKTNALTENTPYAGLSLFDIIIRSNAVPEHKGIFNNSAQVFNHTFYWNSITPEKKEPSQFVVDTLTKSFGSLENFKNEFATKAANGFGAGWAWLVQDNEGDKKLSIITTVNADTPITMGLHPILTCDYWEHAYYLGFQNRRPDYISEFWNVVNWDFVEANLKL